MTTKYHVVLADIHYPEHDANALKVVFDFIRKNRKKIASVTLLGDALDCANLSRHTKGKPRLRRHRGYKEDLDGFTQDILEPIELAVLPACKLTYICGNHEDWIESDLLDEMPELDGIVNIPDVLRLEERGWRWVPVGGHFVRAGFVLLHGDQIGSGIHVAKKMVDSVNENCIMGHVHRYSAFSKAALVTEKKKQLPFSRWPVGADR
jgi:UDP-2,3-diacylglucosamine pyrophosphatase LpxH